MKKKTIYISLIVLFVVSFFYGVASGLYVGLELQAFFGLVATIGLLAWLIRRENSKTSSKGTTSSSKPARAPTQKSRKPDKNAYVVDVAENLRKTAAKFEDPLTEVFFSMEGLQMRRVTKSREFFAHAAIQIARTEFAIDYLNLNSRTAKPQRILKKWKDTIGVTEDHFELYFKDHSFVEFIPTNPAVQLHFSVFWQVFHEGLNGFEEVFQNPLRSGLGHRLREVATYIVENRDLVGPAANVRVSDIPTKLSEDEFFGFVTLKFPELRDKIKRWRLVRELGGGVFGQVFAAENVDTGESGAMKLMSPELKGKKLSTDTIQFRHAREQFLNEAKLSLKLSSPFVATAVDSGTEPWPWILYPLVNGITVEQAFADSSERTSTWWNLAHDLISALSTIHDEGILHLDVKLENMLATEDRFVLLDLGMGQVVDYAEFQRAGFGGTPGYMAPELFGMNPTSKRPGFEADVFSAGITLLSLLDERPRKLLETSQESALQLGDRSSLDSLLSTPLVPQNLSSQVNALLSAMLEPNPEKRPQAKQLLNYVADFVDLEEKLRLLEEYRKDRMEIVQAEDQSDEERVTGHLSGPHESWKKIEDEVYRIVEKVRPRYLIITLNAEDEDEMVYVQAMSGLGGWHVEAMSETFTNLPQSPQVKSNFMRLNWTPPSSSDPNYQVDLEDPPVADLVRLFTDAFEFGYGLKPQEITSVEVVYQGEGKY